MLTLPLQKRPSGLKASRLRSQKKIPAVVYGHGIQNQSFMLDYEVFRKTFEQASYSVLVTLEEGSTKIPTLIHDIQYDPVTDKMTHVDFFAIQMGKKVKTDIPLEFVGVSEAVKLGAVLNVAKHELHVSCLPKDLVRKIPVDISRLQKIGNAIHVRDVKIPAGIEILNLPEEQIVSAIKVKIVVEEVAPVIAEAAAVPAEGTAPAAEGAAPVAEGTAPSAKGAKGAQAPAAGTPEKGKTEAKKPEAKKEEAAGKAKGKEKK